MQWTVRHPPAPKMLKRPLCLPVGRTGSFFILHSTFPQNLPVSRARVEAPPRQPRSRERLGGSLALPEETRDFEPAPSLPGDKS